MDPEPQPDPTAPIPAPISFYPTRPDLPAPKEFDTLAPEPTAIAAPETATAIEPAPETTPWYSGVPFTLDDLTTAPPEYWASLYDGYASGAISADDVYTQRRQRQHDSESALLAMQREQRLAQAAAAPTAPDERMPTGPTPEAPLGQRGFGQYGLRPDAGMLRRDPEGNVEVSLETTQAAPTGPTPRGVGSDIVRGFLRGPLKAVDATGSAAAALAEQLTGLDIEHIKSASVAQAVMPGEPETVPGGLAQGLSQYLTVALPVGRAIKYGLAGASTATTFGQRVLQWAMTAEGADVVADFLAFEPNDPRAANLFNEYFPGYANVVSEYLAAKGDDSQLEGRLKNVLEGRILNATVAGSVFATLKGLKLARAAVQESGLQAKSWTGIKRAVEGANAAVFAPMRALVQQQVEAGRIPRVAGQSLSEIVKHETTQKVATIVAGIVAGEYAGETDEEQAMYALMVMGLGGVHSRKLAKEVADLVPAAAERQNFLAAHEGRLTRVYHGTTTTFEQFDMMKANPEDLYGPGFYFTEDPKVAGGTLKTYRDLGYASPSPTHESERVMAERLIEDLRADADRIRTDSTEAARFRNPEQRLKDIAGSIREAEANLKRLETVAPQVRPAYLDIRQPFDIDARVAPDEVRRLLTDSGHPMAAVPENLEGYVKSNLTGEGVYGSLQAELGSKAAVNEFLQREGYDGITHIGGKEPATHRVWIAFSPDQVHSPFEVAAQARAAKAISGGGPEIITPDDPRSLADQYAAAVIEARRGGPRTHELVRAEAQSLIDQGLVSWDWIKSLAPGTTLEDTHTVALVNQLADSGLKMRALTRQALTATDPAEQLAHARAVVQQLWAHAQLDPKRIGVLTESGRTMSALTEPTSGMNRFLQQFEFLLRDQNAPIDPMAVVRAIDEMQDPGQLAALAKQADKPGFWQMFNEYYVNGLLWGPKSWMANFVGNSATTLWAIPERALAARMGGAGGVQAGEAVAMMEGVLNGHVSAWRLAWTAFKEGESQFEKVYGTGLAKHGEKIEGSLKVISADTFNLVGPAGQAVDAIGNVIRFPMRVLSATDDYFKAINYHMELSAVASREARANLQTQTFKSPKDYTAALEAEKARIMADPPLSVKKSAESFALYQTFTKELGETGQLLQQIGNRPFGRLVLPFVRTPINIFKYAGERTPLALATTSYWKTINGTDRAAADLAKARVALGSMTMSAAAVMAYGGLITGKGPSDPKQRAMLEATGWKPYSLKVGNTYVGINRLEPVGMLFTLAADYVDAVTNSEADTALEVAGDAAWALTVTTAKNFSSHTFVKGLAETMAFIADPDRQSEARASSFLQSLLPLSGLIRQTEAAVDPTLREAQGVMDRFWSSVPGLSATLPPRRTLLDAEPIYMTGAYGPIGISRGKQDKEMNMLIDLGVNVPNIPKQVEQHIALQPEERDYWAVQRGTMTIGGKTLRERIAATVASPQWDTWNNEMRAKRLEDHIQQYHEKAQQKTYEKYEVIKASIKDAEKQERQRAREGKGEPMPTSPLLRSLTR